MSDLQGRLQLAIYQGLKEGEQSIELVERILPLVSGIPWRPIAELPDELKDGRLLDLWIDGRRYPDCNWSNEPRCWMQAYSASPDCSYWLTDEWEPQERQPTHFAEITPPGQQVAYIRDPERPHDPPMEVPMP